MFKILNIEHDDYSLAAKRILKSVGEIHEKELSRAELLDQIKWYDALIVRFGHRVDREVIQAAPYLKAIATATTGLDHIDLKAAAERGVAVISLKGEYEFLRGVSATAEHTWALLLALLRNVPHAFDSVKRGKWDRYSFRGGELYRKSLGIVGYGRIGEKVGKYGRAFDMKIVTYDPYRDKLPKWVKCCDTLDELLALANVVSLHVPLSRETVRMIGHHELSIMTSNSLLINTSRGAIVDESELLYALENNQLAGAALDVVCDEDHLRKTGYHPLVEYARNHSNLLITPHIGGATYESMEKTEIFIAEKLKTFLLESRTGRS
jgi:D-3-phosphoglycerate dehydrogenase